MKRTFHPRLRRILYELLLFSVCVGLPLFSLDLFRWIMAENATTNMQQTTATDATSTDTALDTSSTAGLIFNQRRLVAEREARVDASDDWQIRWLAYTAIAGCASLLVSWGLRGKSTSLDDAKDQLARLELKQVEENAKVEIAKAREKAIMALRRTIQLDAGTIMYAPRPTVRIFAAKGWESEDFAKLLARELFVAEAPEVV